MASLWLTRLLIRTGIAGLLPRVRRLTRGGTRYLPYYSDRVLAAPHDELAEAARFLEMHAPDGIDLAAGAPRFELLSTAAVKLPADRRGCPPPWGLPELRLALAERLAVHPEDEVLVTHGAAGALDVVLDAFVNPGDRVVLFDPTSLLYPLALRQRRARLRWVPTRIEEGRIRFQVEQLARALRGARLLLLANPTSPTGGIFTAGDLEQIAWWAKRRDVLVFSDRAFARYQYEGEPLRLDALPLAQKRTLTAGSFGKDYALAAARVGWLAGHRHLLGACTMAAAPHAAFVPTLCQQLACTALKQDDETFAPLLVELAARRQYVFERLRALRLKPAWPAGGFFFWVPVQHLGLDGATFARRLLCEKKVTVWPGTFFGPSGSEYVRLSYVADEGRLHEGLTRLADLVRALQGSVPNASRVAGGAGREKTGAVLET